MRCISFLMLIPFTDVHPAGVQSGDIRLFGDVRNGYGGVEYHSLLSGWSGICPDSFWNDSDAAAVCQYLGYTSGSVANPVTILSDSSKRIPRRVHSAARCVTTNSVTSGVCTFNRGSSCTSPEGRFAAVQCSKFNYVYMFAVTLITGRIWRGRGGSSPL